MTTTALPTGLPTAPPPPACAVLGHRGWPEAAHPENTLAAVDAALAAGAHGVEIDVRLTADGVAVCCHDDDLARVGGSLGSVRTARGSDVDGVRLTGGHRVPRLVEVLDLAAGRGQVVLDLKPDPRAGAVARAALAALRLSRLTEPAAVASSFDPVVLDVLAVRRPGLQRAAILDVGDPVAPALGRARRRGDSGVHLPLSSVLAEPEEVRAATAGGLHVRAWTVNRRVDAELCALLGVVAVITDVPQVLAARLAAV